MTPTRAEDDDEAKKAFLDRFSRGADTVDGAFETLLGRAIVCMEHNRRMTMNEEDVRFAAVSCGFSKVPSPVRHIPKNRAEFEDFTQSTFRSAFRTEREVTKGAMTVLSFLYDVLSDEAKTKFTIETDGDIPKKLIKLDSPRGIHAHFAVHDWDLLDQFADDNDDMSDYEDDNDDLSDYEE